MGAPGSCRTRRIESLGSSGLCVPLTLWKMSCSPWRWLVGSRHNKSGSSNWPQGFEIPQMIVGRSGFSLGSQTKASGASGGHVRHGSAIKPWILETAYAEILSFVKLIAALMLIWGLWPWAWLWPHERVSSLLLFYWKYAKDINNSSKKKYKTTVII